MASAGRGMPVSVQEMQKATPLEKGRAFRFAFRAHHRYVSILKQRLSGSLCLPGCSATISGNGLSLSYGR